MEPRIKTMKYKGWKILFNPDTGWYDLYKPDDVETYGGNKMLREWAYPEFEDIFTIKEAKEFIDTY